MDTPEFSQEKKKRVNLIKYGQAPFSHREFFENATLEDQKYLGSIQQRRYEISLEKQPGPRQRKVKVLLETKKYCRGTNLLVGSKTLMRPNSEIQGPLVSKRMRVEHEININLAS